MLRTSLLKSTALVLALAAMPASAFAQTFPAWQSTVKYELPSGGEPRFFTNYAKVTSSVRRDGSNYIVRDTGSATRTATFGPANQTGTDANFNYYATSSGANSQTFKLLKPGNALTFTYVQYGHWRETTTGAGFQGAAKRSDTWLVFGPKTASVPLSGTGNYVTTIDGSFVDKTGVYVIGGTGTFQALWGAGTVSFTANPIASGGPTPPTFGAISGTGTHKKGGFSAKGSNATYTMNMSGYFFGPTANEMGATFRLSGGGGNGNGVIVGK
jgi:hypothetical protein